MGAKTYWRRELIRMINVMWCWNWMGLDYPHGLMVQLLAELMPLSLWLPIHPVLTSCQAYTNISFVLYWSEELITAREGARKWVRSLYRKEMTVPCTRVVAIEKNAGQMWDIFWRFEIWDISWQDLLIGDEGWGKRMNQDFYKNLKVMPIYCRKSENKIKAHAQKNP